MCNVIYLHSSKKIPLEKSIHSSRDSNPRHCDPTHRILTFSRKPASLSPKPPGPRGHDTWPKVSIGYNIQKRAKLVAKNVDYKKFYLRQILLYDASLLVWLRPFGWLFYHRVGHLTFGIDIYRCFRETSVFISSVLLFCLFTDEGRATFLFSNEIY